MIKNAFAPRGRAAFTLVELMVSTAVLSLVVVILVTLINHTASLWRYVSAKVEQFSGARDGFESLTRQLGQATLNTYWDYYDDKGETRTADNVGNFTPKNYGRQSELRFVSGSMDRGNVYNGDPREPLAADAARPRPTHGIFFHAPLGLVDDVPKYGGLQGLLNTWGYYVEFDSDERNRPPFLKSAAILGPPRYRYRLMELMQPSEKMKTYENPSDWLKPAVNEAGTPSAHVLAENVVALVLQPMLSTKDEEALGARPSVPGTALAPSYFYDTTSKNPVPQLNPHHQLPPNVRVTMVSIDEPSALRLAQGSTQPDFGLEDLFQTSTADTAAKYEDDLKTLQATLVAKGCSFRVFTTNVVIRGAKWSKQ